jgi:response regulator RpfG family c-di-GMP phosphodiesterase
MNLTPVVEQPSANLLFVDDEPGILSALRRSFRLPGYRVFTAASGAEALDLVATNAIDAVISDMRMPGMDGAALLDAVRRHDPDIVRILLTGFVDIDRTIAAINQGEIFRYLNKPWNDAELKGVVAEGLARRRLVGENQRLSALTAQQNQALAALNTSLGQKVAERTGELSQALSSLDAAHQQLQSSLVDMVRVFAGLLDLRGGGFGEHSRRTAEYARRVAARLRLTDDDQRDISVGALLHDIGTIGWSEAMLAKLPADLCAAEREQCALHPVTGYQLLVGVPSLREAALIVRHHHERYDGEGYPDRLSGSAIPLGARVVTVANDFDSLREGALLPGKRSVGEALAFLREEKGRSYDPEIVDALGDLFTGDDAGPGPIARPA